MNNAVTKLGLLKIKFQPGKILLTCLMISYTVLNLQTALTLLRHFWLRVYLGLDLTDESFNLMNLTNYQDDSVWPYSRILGPIFNLANNDVANYRKAGLVILSILCLVGIIVIMTKVKEVNNFNSFILATLIPLQIVILLFVPSVFRYLLVTPGYQWILITGSVLLTILLVGLVPRYSELTIFVKLILIWVSLILLAMILARLSGGIIAVLSVSLALLWKRDTESFKKYIIFLYSSIFLTSGIFLAINFELIKAYAATMINFSRVLPQAFSLKSEVFDVFLPVIFMLILIALTRSMLQFFSSRFSSARIGIFHYTYLFVILPLIIFGLSKTDVVLGFSLPTNSLAIFCLISIALSLNIRKTELVVVPLILLPFLTLFGSSTPAIGNWQTMLFCVYGFLIFFAVTLRSHVEVNTLRKTHLIIVLFIISASCSILANRIGSDTYEKVLLPRTSPIDKLTNLNYSAEKLNSIKFYRSQAFENGFTSDRSILDLSYFHPGLALMLNGTTENDTIYDRFFQSSLDLQVNNLSSSLSRFVIEKGYILLPVEKNRTFTNSSCQNLSEYLATDPLAKLLTIRGLDPKARFISIYRSDEIDLTLPNSDVVMVKIC
jgi:hypothetical protein